MTLEEKAYKYVINLEEKACEYAINNVCNNCNKCQSYGYIGCDTFRFAKNAYIDGHNDGADEVRPFSNQAKGYFVYDDPMSH